MRGCRADDLELTLKNACGILSSLHPFLFVLLSIPHCVCVCVCWGPHPKVGGGEAVAGGHVGGGGGVSVEGVDVSQQGAHDSRDA